MKNVLVTGSNGFIGTHLCKELKMRQYHITGLGRSDSSKNKYVDNYIKCTLSEVDTIKKLDGISVDTVLHLAADMRKSPYEEEVLIHNCLGTQMLLDWCGEKSIKTFVQLSSLPVIGKPKEHPITETHPVKPPTYYHMTKIMQEMQAQYAADKYGIRTASLRISAPIGTGMNNKTIFATFVRNALNGENLVIYGKGSRRQTYIPASDIAKSICAVAESPNAMGVYNLGSKIFISNLDLAKKCIEILHSSSDIVFNNQVDPEENDSWDINMNKFVTDTGFSPQTSLEDVILEYASSLI